MSESPPAEPPFDGKAFVRTLSTAPGVYRMIAADGSVLYVGKASALKNRVASYFNATPKPTRIMAMLAQVARMEVTVTRTEAEALLLENELIKSLKPRYNVLLRDDKSYPYVLLTNEAWPRIAVQRPIWCCRQGRERLRNTLSSQLRSLNSLCIRLSVSRTAVTLA